MAGRLVPRQRSGKGTGEPPAEVASFPYGPDDLSLYVNAILHDSLRTLAMLGIVLVPMFFVLDNFMMPARLLARIGIYRAVSTVIAIVQFVIIRRIKPGPWSYFHAHFVSLQVAFWIALMTVDLGGFNSSYYAGLNLVIIGANLMLPWPPLHSTVNSLTIIAMYVVLNLLSGQSYSANLLMNNLFFLCATAIIAISIGTVRHRLLRTEFTLLVELKRARDALSSEMDLAKRIQTALLPRGVSMPGYEVAATMVPAQEVGGDYYDVIESPKGATWVAMGDVSGHGVDSGLIMMMAQTSIISTLDADGTSGPSSVLVSVNGVIRENVARLGSDHYMTMTLLRLDGGTVTAAGKHQDLLVYRASDHCSESIPSTGTWLGIIEDISEYVSDFSFQMRPGDVLLLFTDGITEAMNRAGEMYGQERLQLSLDRYAHLPVAGILERIMEDVRAFHFEQQDDMTLVVIKRMAQ